MTLIVKGDGPNVAAGGHMEPFGERAVLVRWPGGMDRGVNRWIQRLADRLEARIPQVPGLEAVVAGFDSMVVEFDPLQMDAAAVAAVVRWASWNLSPAAPGRRVAVPVCYEGPCAPDLEEVARACGMSPATVVRLHAGRAYHIYCLGFQAGFPYAGPLPPILTLPRRSSPRDRVPQGAVAIAGAQTGIYPRTGPGGWHILGQTPWEVFQPDRDPPTPYLPGDELWFYPITLADFQSWDQKAGAHGGP